MGGAAVCPRCADTVALHEGTPLVSSTGAVELWHPSCFAVRHARPVEEVTVVLAEPSRRSRQVGGIAAGVAVAAIAVGSYVMRVELPRASLATINVDPVEPLVLHSEATQHEETPALPDERARHPVPSMHGTPVDELYPSLAEWIHPVIGTDMLLSNFSTGMFGAERDGVMRRECGRGHCGIDLAGPIGRPIVAVAAGVVVRVERSELGRDGRSGRYVRIEHADGTLTAYMHLNAIARGLEVNDRVDAGQQIGTLGATGISSAAPHLHFSLEVPKIPGTHGDHVNTHYIDPAPYLARSTIRERADRRRSEKPAF